jgi:hypothetical protein
MPMQLYDIYKKHGELLAQPITQLRNGLAEAGKAIDAVDVVRVEGAKEVPGGGGGESVALRLTGHSRRSLFPAT